MRKRIFSPQATADKAEEIGAWIDLENFAEAELTSEDPAHPIEAALRADTDFGWQAAAPGRQMLRFRFDQAVPVSRIRLLFHEADTARTQEFVLRWRSDPDSDYREIVRQQYHFDPPGTTEEREEYRVEIEGMTELELQIVPDIGGGPARASLAQLRLG